MTRARGFAALLAAALAVCGMPAAAAQDSAASRRTFIAQAIDEVVARYELPGIAVGVVVDGQVVYRGTRGELVAGSGQKIDPDTLFKIGSNSKAMTTSVLARLVDAGKLRWDDPVTRHLPQFRMHDPWVTREMQVRDLLIHNSGLRQGAGDLMLWPEPNLFTRADIIAGLAHLKPQQSFRSGYAYDNLLYVVAGEVAAAAGGASYEELVRREVFEPLGLSRCRVGEFRRDMIVNLAQPHMRKEGRNVLIRADDAVVIPAITSAAAGGIRCSLNDMLVWALNWLAPTPAQQAWLSAEQRQALWTPQMPMPVSARRREWDGSHFLAYGYGWRLADVHGAWSVSHTGTLAGMYSMLHLLPGTKSGLVVLINGDGGDARTVLNQMLVDHFTTPGHRRSLAEYAAGLASEPSAGDHRPMPDTSSRQPVTAVEMARWLGTYRDPWFGEVTVCERDDRVVFKAAKSPLLSGAVMRAGQRYLVDWHDASVDAEAWLDFAGGRGPIAMSMAKVDPEADFSYDYEDLAFIRIGGCR